MPLGEGDQVYIHSPRQTMVVNNAPSRRGAVEIESEQCEQLSRIGNTYRPAKLDRRGSEDRLDTQHETVLEVLVKFGYYCLSLGRLASARATDSVVS